MDWNDSCGDRCREVRQVLPEDQIRGRLDGVTSSYWSGKRKYRQTPAIVRRPSDDN
jgi:hypothetical protein